MTRKDGLCVDLKNVSNAGRLLLRRGTESVRHTRAGYDAVDTNSLSLGGNGFGPNQAATTCPAEVCGTYRSRRAKVRFVRDGVGRGLVVWHDVFGRSV